MEEKHDEKWKLEKITWSIKELERKVDGQESKIETAKGFNLNIFRVIFAALAIVITIAVIIFGIFGVASWRDLQSIGKIADQVEGMKVELEGINKAIQKASLKETIPLPISEKGIYSVADSPAYTYYFVGFVKRKSYETIHFSTEFKNMDPGEPAYFRFLVTDNKETTYSEEYRVVTPEYRLIEENVDISSLENGPCKYAYSIKTKGKKGVFLRNIYVLIYSKLFFNDNSTE